MSATPPVNQLSWYYLPLLVLAGESVFILPFMLPRIFRPTVLSTFGVDNVQLGLCFSAYGVVALLAYLFGGPLADRYPARKLLAAALLLTAAGGLYAATYPGYLGLRLLYAYWGFTTIFLFWAPLIKATRVWGQGRGQGRAYGWLDGGRGLVGALFGALGFVVFTAVASADTEATALTVERASFRRVLLVSSGLVAVVGVLVGGLLRAGRVEKEVLVDRISPALVWRVLQLPAVLLLMVIILCAYVGYKVTDVFSQYANEVLGYDKTAASLVGSQLQFLRPAVGLAVGFLLPRRGLTWWLLLSFVAATLGAGLFAIGLVTPTAGGLFALAAVVTSAGVYAARSLYFAVMQAGNIPLALTGTAVGLISLVGYTPDIFSGPAMGYFLDGWPGLPGFRRVFAMMAAFSLIGLATAIAYYRKFATER